MDADMDQRIRERAYEIWIREGRPLGRHVQHWHQAQAEIAAEGEEHKAIMMERTETVRMPAAAAPRAGPARSRQVSGGTRRRSPASKASTPVEPERGEPGDGRGRGGRD